jgi:hypothetical protein
MSRTFKTLLMVLAFYIGGFITGKASAAPESDPICFVHGTVLDKEVRAERSVRLLSMRTVEPMHYKFSHICEQLVTEHIDEFSVPELYNFDNGVRVTVRYILSDDEWVVYHIQRQPIQSETVNSFLGIKA